MHGLVKLSLPLRHSPNTKQETFIILLLTIQAYLAYGVPKNDFKFFSLMQKVCEIRNKCIYLFSVLGFCKTKPILGNQITKSPPSPIYIECTSIHCTCSVLFCLLSVEGKKGYIIIFILVIIDDVFSFTLFSFRQPIQLEGIHSMQLFSMHVTTMPTYHV